MNIITSPKVEILYLVSRTAYTSQDDAGISARPTGPQVLNISSGARDTAANPCPGSLYRHSFSNTSLYPTRVSKDLR